jgi:hypothetical protein
MKTKSAVLKTDGTPVLLNYTMDVYVQEVAEQARRQ